MLFLIALVVFPLAVFLALPIGGLVLVVLGLRLLLRGRALVPYDPRWVSVYDAAAGVVLLLAAHGAVARGVGALLAVGAAVAGTHDVERGRSLVFAFVAGVSLLLAPVAAAALAISAGWRWVERA